MKLSCVICHVYAVVGQCVGCYRTLFALCGIDVVCRSCGTQNVLSTNCVYVFALCRFTLCNIYCDKECFPHRSGYGDLWDDIQNLQEDDSSGHGISVSSEEAEGSKENSEIERKEESSDWVKSEEEENEDEEDNTDDEDEADEEEEEKGTCSCSS